MFDKYRLGVRQSIERAEILFLLAMFFTLLPSFSLAGENEAYQHLYEVMDRCHTVFLCVCQSG